MPSDPYGKTNLQPGFRLFSGEQLSALFARILQGGLDRADSLTAHAGGTKAAAYQLTASLNRVTTCATSADSVLLPKAIAGSVVTLTNSGAADMAVYGKSSDTIDAVATASPQYIGPGETKQFVCLTAAAWQTVRAPSFRNVGIVAAAGATQGNATSIGTARVISVTVTASTQGVKLPLAVTGLRVEVFGARTVGVKVYPGTNDLIQGAATNVAVVLASNKSNIYQAISSSTWRVLKGA